MQVIRSGTLAAGNAAVGNNEFSSLRYFHHDHQGSTIAVSNEAGVVIERMAFDPWGKRRNVNGLVDASDSINGLTTDRGYTGHEHLDEMGIIHMNGRIYDPLIGRFMSADPYIQAPDNLQSYNRYAYVMNNPLNLTDPSGYLSWSKFRDKWLRPVVAIAVAIYAPQFLANIGFSGAVAGATGLSAGFVGSITAGFLSGAVASGSLKGALQGAFTAGMFFGVGELGLGAGSLGNIAAHGAVGCVSSAASGGSCRSGALSGAFGEAIGPYLPKFGNIAIDTAVRAIAGGVGAVVGGGKFENGAVTGAFGYLFNELQHRGGTSRQRLQSAGYVETGYSDGSYCNIQGRSNCGHPGNTRVDASPMTLQIGVSGQAGAWVFGGSIELGIAVPTTLNDVCIYAQGCSITGPQSVFAGSGAVGVGQGTPTTGTQASQGGTWFGGNGAFGNVQLTVNQGSEIQGTRGVIRGGVGTGAGAGYATCNQATACLIK